MKKNKLIFLIVFGILALACLWAFLASSVITHNFKKEIAQQKTDDQKITISNLVIIETKDNIKYWELSADSGSYDGGSQEATLYGIIGNFYRDNKVIVSFKGDEANFNQDTKKITLKKGGVFVYEDGTSIRANAFDWEGTNNLITAKGDIKIVQPDKAVITGSSALLSNEMTKFQITGRTITKLFGEGKIE